MKQLGNLANICAQRKNTLLQIFNGKVSVYVGCGPDRVVLSADWHDDEKIMQFIMELNHGRLKEKNTGEENVAA